MDPQVSITNETIFTFYFPRKRVPFRKCPLPKTSLSSNPETTYLFSIFVWFFEITIICLISYNVHVSRLQHVSKIFRLFSISGVFNFWLGSPPSRACKANFSRLARRNSMKFSHKVLEGWILKRIDLFFIFDHVVALESNFKTEIEFSCPKNAQTSPKG